MDSPPRKATISQIDALGRLGLVYADSGIGGPPLARPFVGGASSGFHSAPQQGDQVLVHHEHPWRPAAVTSVAAHPERLTPLNPGESALYHPDGRVLSYVKNDGSTTIWSKPGKPSTTIDANGVWNLGGLAGVATLDANSHVQQQAVYDATEAQTNDTLGSTSTIVNNLNRIRYQLGQMVGGAWTAAMAMIPLSQKAAASGVASLNASSLVVQDPASKGQASGVAALDANSHVLQREVYDSTEASTLDTLGATSTLVNNLNRIRNQLGVVIGNAGTSWNAAVQMIPLSQKGAASGVAPLTAQKVLDLSSAGTPSVAGAGAQGTGFSLSLAAGSTDARGVVNMTTGTGTTAGAYWTLTFSTPLTRTPVVLLAYTGPNTGSAPIASSISTTGFTMTNAPMAASATFNIAYVVLE